jgi:hypothetical protein
MQSKPHTTLCAPCEMARPLLPIAQVGVSPETFLLLLLQVLVYKQHLSGNAVCLSDL